MSPLLLLSFSFSLPFFLIAALWRFRLCSFPFLCHSFAVIAFFFFPRSAAAFSPPPRGRCLSFISSASATTYIYLSLSRLSVPWFSLGILRPPSSLVFFTTPRCLSDAEIPFYTHRRTIRRNGTITSFVIRSVISVRIRAESEPIGCNATERRRLNDRRAKGEDAGKAERTSVVRRRRYEEWKSYFHNILNCFRVGEMRAETPKGNVARKILERRTSDFHRSILADCNVTPETQRFFAICGGSGTVVLRGSRGGDRYFSRERERDKKKG